MSHFVVTAPVRAPLLVFLTAWGLIACGGQDPAFSESRTDRPLRGHSTGGADASSANAGAEYLDPSSIGIDVDTLGGGQGDPNAYGGDDAMGSGGLDGNGADSGIGGNGSGGGDGTDGGYGGNPGDEHLGGLDGSGGDDSNGGLDGGDDTFDPGNENGVGFVYRTVEVVQEGPGKVDILWVVDSSGSMAEEQQYLANNFNALITQLASAGHDFQTAVTTTDVCHNTMPSNLAERVCPASYGGSSSTRLRGSFRGQKGRQVLKHDDSDLVQLFNQYTKAGTNGSGFEHGLEAARLAVSKVLSGQNDPLIRDDAFLAVIVVSDEEDDGIGLSKVDAYNGINFVAQGLTTFRFTEDDMIAYLQSVKGAGNFSISAIAPTRLANGKLCSAPHSQPLEEGTQYIKAAAKSGGIIQSICDTNWNTSLATIGLDLNAQITQVSLPTIADAATIKVWVDGVLNTQWTYNAGNNAVKFDSDAVPAPGSLIKVGYYELP